MSLLFSRRLGPLLATQTLGAINDNLFKNALVVLVLFHAGAGGPALVAAAGGVFILPYVLFSALAGQIADRVRAAFPGAQISFEPDAVRSKIVDSWPEDMDDSRARADWGWKPAYDVERAFAEYLVPTISMRYSQPSVR